MYLQRKLPAANTSTSTIRIHVQHPFKQSYLQPTPVPAKHVSSMMSTKHVPATSTSTSTRYLQPGDFLGNKKRLATPLCKGVVPQDRRPPAVLILYFILICLYVINFIIFCPTGLSPTLGFDIIFDFYISFNFIFIIFCPTGLSPTYAFGIIESIWFLDLYKIPI